MRRVGIWLIAALVATGVSACADGERASMPVADGDGPVLATYESGVFTGADFQRIAERLTPQALQALEEPERKRQFVEAHALNAMLVHHGRTLGYDRDPDIVRQVAELERSLILRRVMEDLREPAPISDEALAPLYEANKLLYSGAQIRASHILVKDEALAHRLRAEIVADPERFTALATEHSIDQTSKKRGGDLGFFGQGRMVAAFEQAAFALGEPGDVSEVVATPFGYHVIMLTDVRSGRIKTFDEVKDRIRAGVLAERRQGALAARLKDLRAEAALTLDDAAIAAVAIPAPEPGLQPTGGH